MIIQSILGRRPRTNSKRRVSAGKHLSGMKPSDAKFDYEYLVKYKSMSYLHVKWLSGNDIDAMNSVSQKLLVRYLNRLDRGLF